MSIKTDYVAAIDVGTTKIVALIGKKDAKGKIKILGMGKANSNGVKRGVVHNAEDTAIAIQTAVGEAETNSGIKFANVFVGIAGQHIKSLKNRHSKYIQSLENEITLADVAGLTDDMYKISLEAGEEIIHVIPQSYIVDNEAGIKRPVGMYGKKLEGNFHVVVGQVAAAKNLKKCVEKAGFKVVKLILEPIASADAVLSDDEKEAGVALVDIGGGTTDLAVYYDGVIRHTAVIPYGGNVITNDIKEGLGIIQRYAESLKVKYGSALGDLAPENKVVTIPSINGGEPKEMSFRSLAYIIQARVEEIIDAIAFEIENSGFMDKLGAGIALTGGGALLKNLSQLVKFRTGLDVRIAYPKVHLSIDGINEINQPMYSTSVGLILKGYEHYESIKDEPVVLVEPKVEVQAQPQMEEQEEVEEKPKPKMKDKFFSSFKETFTSLFEEKDTKM